MIKLVYSNKTERLLEELAKDILEWRENGAHPLDPVELVVPNRNMETWVRLGLAQLTGVAANLRFRWLNRFISELVSKACPGEIKLADLDIAEAAVLAALMDDALLETPELRPVSRYLQSTGAGGANPEAYGFDTHLARDGADLRRVQLAARMAFLFQEYSFSRPEMIAAWRRNNSANQVGDPAGLPFADPAAIDPSVGTTAAWQRALWRAVFGSGGILEQNPPEEGGRWVTMDLLPFESNLFKNIRKSGLPPVHIFGISYMARIFQHLFARLGEIVTLRIYTLNPCAEFWEDVETPRGFYLRLDQELDRREQLAWKGGGESENQDPFGLFAKDSPALLYWGRPGCEHMRLLGELTECDFTDAFENPLDDRGGLLHRLQLDILTRTPERNMEQDLDGATPGLEKADGTIKLVAAPSVRREVEWVADEIWRLMREDNGPPLRFSDVAIIVNSAERDIYLPMIEAVFAACHDLPCSISDLPGSSGSRMMEAMSLLLKLPFGRFSRSEMLALMGHPAVIGGFDDLTPEDLAGMAERLGIIFGADHLDHAGTYIDEDIYNWDQGIRRLALGAFMTGEKSGDQRIFETGEGKWLVEEVSGTAAGAAARFGLLARSLLADARFVRRQKMTLTRWAKFYSSQIETYFYAKEGADERERLMLRRALGKLETMDLGHKVSGRVAAEIAGRALDLLEGGRGQYLAEGVAVSTFLPMRAIPFRVVFLLGLGEGLFPASGQRDALDLRAVRRREGDVDPSERDRYMFLETLLCTREKLYLSYVSRDEHTGDPLQPSAVVQELLHILKFSYLGQDGIKLLNIEPPLQLRRYDEEFDRRDTFFDEARAEARVQEIAREWRTHIYRENRGKNADGFTQIKRFVNPEHRAALSRMLALPGEPPAAGSVTATARFTRHEEEGILEAPVSLSFSVLRRFLECPMQGWASALLGLNEVGDDPADREEEDFEINRLTEIMLLSDLFYQVVAGGDSSETDKLYRERLVRLRLAGQIPAGALGEVIRKRHLRIIEGWLSLLDGFKGEFDAGNGTSAGCPDLHQVRLGRSSQQGSTGIVLDPLLLEVPLGGTEKQDRIVPVRISGLTEGLSSDRLISVSIQARKPPLGNNRQTWESNFRYLLRGAVTQTALAAMNAAGSGERQIVVLYADGANNPGGLRLRLRPLDPERARAWLTVVAAELLGGPHAYLLPCEAVFREYVEREAGSSVDGANLCSLIKSMADNEFVRFSSLWGPVPSPRLYEPPSAGEAARMVTRRFEPLFREILGREVL